MRGCSLVPGLLCVGGAQEPGNEASQGVACETSLLPMSRSAMPKTGQSTTWEEAKCYEMVMVSPIITTLSYSQLKGTDILKRSVYGIGILKLRKHKQTQGRRELKKL